MAAEEGRSPHVVLFPFLAHGHIPAFLRLAGHLQALRPGLAVTLVSTQRILGSLSLPATSPPIQLHALPFAPADHGLPDGAHSLADLHVHQFITFFQASESLRPAFDGFVAGIRSPVCIIADAFFAWTADVARARGASHAVFLPGGAFGNAVFFSVWEHLPHTLTAGDEFPLLPDFPDVVLHRTQIPPYMLAATGADPWTAFFRRVIPSCRKTDAVLVNTVQQLEPSGLDMLRASFGVQTWPIGPILAAPAPSKSRDDDDITIIQWLDAHPRRSVLYISFGSQNSISIRQMTELALGLEASGWPFIWAVRPPLGFDPKDGFDPEWLPAGFEDRMAARASGRGLVVRGWAPQARILAHPSTGAFLTHCGWNSILESLRHGVPLLGWPVGAEQFFNAMVVVEWGVCVEVARGNLESSAVESAEVAEAVGTVMGETEKGEAMRRKAGAIAHAMAAASEGPGGSSSASLERFLRCVEASALRDSCLSTS
uniref:Glycosyltransferase n=1 Tax=Oryza punctata TaxID=4537 RepID=A0A0E0KSJ7_ORYPU